MEANQKHSIGLILEFYNVHSTKRKIIKNL
jgi:hypothetical protein